MKESVAATRSRRNIEKQFYAEEEEDDEEEEENRYNLQAGNFVYIFVHWGQCVPSG